VKLLVVGHPFLLAYNQRKYAAMKKQDKDLQLRMLVPNRGCDRFHVTDFQIHDDLSLEEVVALKPYLRATHMTYVHAPTPIATIMRHFRPDVIHIEEEPQAFITLETIALRDAYAPDAAVSLFTWDNILRLRQFPLGLAKHKLRAYALRRSSLTVCGNQEAAELLEREGLFHGQVEVIPQYGIDAAEHAPRSEAELRRQLGLEDSTVIGYIGQLVERKGLRLLFEALERLGHRRWKLLLVGSGPLEAEIRECWMPKLPGRVVLVPAVPYEEVPRYFRCLDIFVLMSQTISTWKEQFGLALAQAMMCGVACVGSNCGAIPDTLGPGGSIVEQRDAEGLERALESFLASEECRARAGKEGRDYALQKYSLECVTARYLGAFYKARQEKASAAKTGKRVFAMNSGARKAQDIPVRHS